MGSECFALFIDESGTGSKSKSKTNFWVSVGVFARIADHKALEADLLALRKNCMRLHNKEMKGADLSPVGMRLFRRLTPSTIRQNIIQKHGFELERIELNTNSSMNRIGQKADVR